jgi:hypothetical protein
MNRRSSRALGWLVLLCTVTAVPAVVACHKDESAASGAPSASAPASASAAAVASAEPSASAADSAVAAADVPVPSTTATVPTPQDFETQAKNAVTPETIDTQLNAIEKEITGDTRK